MKAIFSEAESFNADLSGWLTSSVFDMSNAFFRAHSFNGNIGSWDVSNVLDFEQMFGETYLVGADLSTWTTSSAKNMNVGSGALLDLLLLLPVSSNALALYSPCSTFLLTMEI